MRPEDDNDAAPAAESDLVRVSPEMIAVFGREPDRDDPAPPDAMTVRFQIGHADAPGLVQLGDPPRAGDAYAIVFKVSRAAVTRLGGAALVAREGSSFHLTGAMRTLAGALREPPCLAPARGTWRLAKSIELLLETIRAAALDELIPAAGDGDLSADDTRRVIAARRLIEERWSEKLTLDQIARGCGMNRAKLTRGFRELFACSVADALAAQRLSQASRLLLTTDLPVSSVGYQAGYLNNASFARAFGRRFGRSPSSYRTLGLAA